MRKILDTDPITGIKHVFHYDHLTDEATITAEQDMATFLDANKRAFNDDTGRYGEFNKVASIPMVVYWDLKKKGIIDDPVAMKKWLNDPDNRFFRTKAGRV